MEDMSLYAARIKASHHKLTMLRSAGLRLTAMVDADWSTSNSTAGWIVFLAGCAISIGCKRERCVAISTTEAELVAASMAAADVALCRTILGFCCGAEAVALPTPLAVDNQGAVAISQDPTMRSSLKHIQRRHYFVRDMVENGEIAVLKVDTAVNTADVLTKHLDTERHRLLAAQLRGGAGLGVKL